MKRLFFLCILIFALLPIATDAASGTLPGPGPGSGWSVPDPDEYYLSSGDEGDEVEELQGYLIALGYLSGTADGEYGKKTVAAVKLYQKNMELKQTGSVSYSLFDLIELHAEVREEENES